MKHMAFQTAVREHPTTTDKDGNFYFANDLNQVEIGLPGHGVIFKISKDGSKIEVAFADGQKTLVHGIS